MKKYKVVHQRNNCIGCISCSADCPQSWELDKSDGLARLKGSKQEEYNWVGEISEADLTDNLAAEKNCPVQIIKIEK